jgi:hypothetical protein
MMYGNALMRRRVPAFDAEIVADGGPPYAPAN